MKRILSGITPSGDGSLHIGNYLGMVKQSIEMARENECFLFVADFHALTTIQNKGQLQKNVESLILNELALLKGFLTPEEFDRLVFYRQSDLEGFHPELQTILNNVTPLGLLKRAHAYKDKLQKDITEDDINVGLFSYPILMASDILLYKPDFVPVGKDQKQHVEIARDVGERFNHIYKKQVFKLPEAFIPDSVATVLGTDGKRKMSKSLGNIISIFDSEDTIKKQVMGTYTDPTRAHATDVGHIEGNMVFAYLDFFGEKAKVDEMKTSYTKGQIADVAVKQYLYESLLVYFKNARDSYEELKNNPELVKGILSKGKEKAMAVAESTMKEVRETIGLSNAYSIQKGKKSTITIDDFAAVDIRVGKVESAEHVEKSEKLIRLHIDFGNLGKRVIFTGVRQYGYTADSFIGKQFFFIVNLAPRKMMGEESQGMIVAADDKDNKPVFLSGSDLPIGSRIR
ncbi:MAG: tryptophan--tRNA ligase [Microgenomates group bacterium]